MITRPTLLAAAPDDRSDPPGPAEVFESLSTAVLLLDADLRVRTMNGAAEALLELSANQVRACRIDDVLPATRRYRQVLARALRTGQVLAERELEIGLAGGATVTVGCMVTPLERGTGGATLLVELVGLDRHKRIAREARMLSEHESARALVRAVAHEVRNPLGGLRGAAQLLDRELADPALSEYTQVIVREADRLQNLLDRMLGPRTPPRKRPSNVHEVTERVVALLGAEAPPGVSVTRDYDPSIPALEADPDLLIQALLNVGRNAVQALDGAGRVLLRTRIERQVTVGGRRHRLVVRIDVVDDGQGIPNSIADRVFYPLVTGRDGGTGLGLSIAQMLVQQHGGLIACTSEPGHTVFSLLLPVDGEAA